MKYVIAFLVVAIAAAVVYLLYKNKQFRNIYVRSGNYNIVSDDFYKLNLQVNIVKVTILLASFVTMNVNVIKVVILAFLLIPQLIVFLLAKQKMYIEK